MKGKVVLAGGSGFLGGRLAEFLSAEYESIVILTRHPRPRPLPVREVAWDGRSAGSWVQELEGAAAVVNLAGKNVNCRYTPANREEIMSSRVNSVLAIGQALRGCSAPPPVWVQTSSLAIYGNPGEAVCTESAPEVPGFPAIVCTEWEKALNQAALSQMRTVVLRIGFVLDRGRGAMAMLERLVRWYLGGRVGSGRQYISWIHWRDMNEMFRWGIERENIRGVYNATAPEPVTNADFMRELRRVMGRPWSPPAPALAARIGAWFLQTEASLALGGRRCVPDRFLREGFHFQFPRLREALEDVEGRSIRRS